jgi:hypothetical protein
MEKVRPKLFIIGAVPQNTHHKTVELNREVFDLVANKSDQRFLFSSPQSNVHFLNLILTLMDYPPKNFNEETVQTIKNKLGNNFPKIAGDVCLFMNLNVIPLSKKTIDDVIEFTQYNGITLVSGDCFCFSLKNYLEIGSPMVEELFGTAHRNMIAIDQLNEMSFDLNGNKTYGKCGEKMFYSANLQNQNWQKDYWEKCESILVDGIYEDRSIKH